MQKVFIRSAYNVDARAVSRKSGISCDPEGCKVKRSFKDEVDINTIVKRFGLTQQLPQAFKAPMMGDFTGVDDFHTAMNAVREAEESFMQVPPHLRKRFSHDPQELMRFLDDDKNRPEAEKLGLVPRPVEKTRDVIQAVDELAARIVPRDTK